MFYAGHKIEIKNSEFVQECRQQRLIPETAEIIQLS